MSIVLVNDYLNGMLNEKKVFWNYLLDGIQDIIPIDIPIMLDSGLYNNSECFEENVKNYIIEKVPNCKIIIQNGSYFGLIPFNAKKIILIQDNLRKIRPNNNVTQDENFINADFVVYNSKEIEDYYYERKMIHIPLCVDSELFKPIDNKEKTKLQLEMNIPIYIFKKIGIFVGSFTEIKGWTIMKNIVNRRKDIFWLLVTKHEDEVFESINSYVYNKIDQETLVKLLNCADFFIMTSPSESQCLAAIEANLCNLPVLMRKTGYFTDMDNNEISKVGVITDTFCDNDINYIIQNNFEPRNVVIKRFSITEMINKWYNFLKCVYFEKENYDETYIFKKESLQINFKEDFVDKLLPYYFKKDDNIKFIEIGSVKGNDSYYIKNKFKNTDAICIEASTELYSFLKEKVKKINTIKIFNDCIYNHNGIIRFHIKKNVYNNIFSGLHGIFDRGQEYGNDVEYITCKKLDTFCKENNINDIDILKIEANGTTFDILNDNQILKNIKILLIQTEDYQFYKNQKLDRDVINLLLRNNFKLISKIGYYPTEHGKQYSSIWINRKYNEINNIVYKSLSNVDTNDNEKNIINIDNSNDFLINKKKTISYVCLIYHSINYLKFLYDQFNRYTKLKDEDEFYFVANDASKEVLDYLKENNIKHYVFNNTEEHKKEWYINNVYRAYNMACKMAKCEYVVFLNSDFAFSENWSENLQKYINDDICLCSRLVERGPEDGGLSSGKYGIEKSFGSSTKEYREHEFIKYTKEISENKICKGGLYMPLMIKKEHMEKINYYPEGNVIEDSDIFNPVYATKDDLEKGYTVITGDFILIEKLKTIGIHHYTCFNSIVYHFQQGEKSEE